MNKKRFILAIFVGGFTMWLLAGIWHELIMATFYERESHATHEGTGIIFIAYMVLSSLMVYLYSLVSKGGRPIVEGLKFGVLIGLLWVFPHELTMAGAHGNPLAYVFKNAVWHMVEQGIGGVIIAFVFGK